MTILKKKLCSIRKIMSSPYKANRSHRMDPISRAGPMHKAAFLLIITYCFLFKDLPGIIPLSCPPQGLVFNYGYFFSHFQLTDLNCDFSISGCAVELSLYYISTVLLSSYFIANASQSRKCQLNLCISRKCRSVGNSYSNHSIYNYSKLTYINSNGTPLTYIIHRFLTGDELLSAAKKSAIASRKKVVGIEQRFLTVRDEFHTKRGPVNQKALSQAVANVRRIPRSNFEYMRLFLKNSKRNGCVIPDSVDPEAVFPKGGPVIEHLLLHCQQVHDTWAYPSLKTLRTWRDNRGLDTTYPSDVDVREYIIGEDSAEKLKDFTDWVFQMYEKDQLEYPSQVMSFDTEQIKCSEYDCARMAMYRGRRICLSSKLGRFCSEDEEGLLGSYKDAWTNLPAKIFMGNGITWAAVVSFPFSPAKNGDWIIDVPEQVPAELADFFNDLPIMVGLGVSQDVQITERFIRLFTNKPVHMQSRELENLLVLAGWASATNMTSVSLQLLGATLNKEVSQGDELWPHSYYQLPAALKAYMVADIKFGHIAWHTALSCLQREMFPDVEAVCHYTRSNQRTVTRWFSTDLINVSLRDIVVNDMRRSAATTREELILSLCYKDISARAECCPDRIQSLAILLSGVVPTVVNGGPRYLHQAREHLIYQAKILYEAGHAHLFKDVQDADRLYLRFNREGGFLASLDWTLPVPHEGNHEPAGLVVHDDLQCTIPDPDFESRDLPYFVFADQAYLLKRDMRGVVFEWLRISPVDRVPKFVRFYDTYRSEHYDRFRTYYEPAKLMYVHCLAAPPFVSEYAEERRARARESIVKEERSKLARLSAATELQRHTLERIEVAAENCHDNDLAAIPVMSLPLTAGLIKKRKVINNPNTRGRDRTRQLVDHRDVLTSDHVARLKPWSSRKKLYEEDRDDRGHLPPTYFAHGLSATMKRTRVREIDEHTEGSRASRKRSKQIPMVHTEDGLQVPGGGGCSKAFGPSSSPTPCPRTRSTRPARQMTQDEVEEDDGRYQNCYF